MKSDKDIKDEVLQEMKQNGTLIGDPPAPCEGINVEEVRAAFIERFSSKMNEELKEPYGHARVRGEKTDSVINECFERFANMINQVCRDLFLRQYPQEELKERLQSRLDERYKR